MFRAFFFNLRGEPVLQQNLLRVEKIQSNLVASRQKSVQPRLFCWVYSLMKNQENRQKRKKRKPTRQWIHRREERGVFYQLVKEITVEDEKKSGLQRGLNP